MKNLLYSVMLLVLPGWAFALGNGKVIPLKSWTVMVYIAADNNLDEYAEFDLREMMSVPLPENANIIVQIDRSKAMTWAKWSTCRRLEIKKNLDYTVQYVEDIGEINTGNPDQLTRFIDWTVEKYPAQNYGLIIWNHGDGWRFNDFKKPTVPEPIYKAVASDDSSGDRLFLHEVSTAIKKCKHSFSKEPFGFIGFDACLMGMMEVWYELKDFAKYGVASEDVESGLGWPYHALLTTLTATKAVEPKALVQSLVRDYSQYYTVDNPDKFTLSAVDLAKMGSLAAQLSVLSAELLKQPAAIAAARSSCSPYYYRELDSWPNGIDLKKFLLGFLQYSKNTQTNAQVNAFLKALEAVVIANARDEQNEKAFGSYGLAIYFPENKSIFQRDPDGKGYLKNNKDNPVAFVKQEKWADFLMAYYNSPEKKKNDDQEVRGQLKSPLNPNPTDTEVRLYQQLAPAFALDKAGAMTQLKVAFNGALKAGNNDSTVLGNTLHNVLLAYFEDRERGVRDLQEVELVCQVLNQMLKPLAALSLVKKISHTYRFIDEGNQNGDFSPPAYGVLCAIGEMLIRLEKDTAFNMLAHMLLADNYAALQQLNMNGNRQVRTAYNVFIDEATERKEYEQDICFKRSVQGYQHTLDYVSGLKKEDKRIIPLQFFTYYALSKLYSRYAFLYGPNLEFLQKLEAITPAYQQNRQVSNFEFLTMNRNRISALARAGRSADLLKQLPAYYQYLELEQPHEKLMLSNGTINMEDDDALSGVFANANIFASPASINPDNKAFDLIIQSLYQHADLKTAYKDFLNAFEHSKWVEGPLNNQLVGLANEGQIRELLNNMDSITAFENNRVNIRNYDEFKMDSGKVQAENLGYFYYAAGNRTLYVLMKKKDQLQLDTIVYPEFFEDKMLRAKYIDDKYKLIREEKIFKCFADFFADNQAVPILVIPHAFIFQTPLDGMSDGQGHYLLEQLKFRYAFDLRNPDAPALNLSAKQILAVGAPEVFTTIFPYLPNGSRELDSINVSLGKKNQLKTLVGKTATDIQVDAELGKFDIAHFATHSYYMAKRPFASGIVLGKEAQSDGILTAYEFGEALKKRTKPFELITLSSCNGGEGTLVSNGSLGLTYTLLLANVANVVSSTEQVNDRTGQFFMDWFYKSLNGGMDIPSSIQLAKLKVKKLYPSRAFWSNFNLYVK